MFDHLKILHTEKVTTDITMLWLKCYDWLKKTFWPFSWKEFKNKWLYSKNWTGQGDDYTTGCLLVYDYLTGLWLL